MLSIAYLRLVHASSSTALRYRSNESSDTLSTRGHGLSSRQNVSCRVKVAVVLRTTNTRPLSILKSKLVVEYTADRASFTGRFKSIYDPKLTPVPSTFVLKHSAELTKPCVDNALGQLPVPGHPRDIQIFDRDDTKPVDQTGGSLVQIVFAGIRNSGVQSGNLELLPSAPAASFDPAAQYPLSSSQPFKAALKYIKRSDYFACAQGSHRLDSEIYSNLSVAGRKLRPFFLNRQSDKIAPGRILDYRDAARLGFDHSGPVNIQPSNLSDGKIVVLPVPDKTTSTKFSALFRIVFTLESGILGAVLKEVSVGSIQVPKRLLKRHARRLLQPERFGFLFPTAQRRTRCAVSQPLAGFLERRNPQSQGPVIHVTNTAEKPLQRFRLGKIWVNSEPVFDFDAEIYSVWSMPSQDDFYRGRHVVHRLSVHLVFITKYRRKAITDLVWEALKSGFESAAARLGLTLRETNHNSDHVHLVVDYPPSLSVSEIVNALKGVSSRIARRDCMPEIREKLWGEHFWSPSYFAASCGGAPLKLIQQYVETQRERPSTPA